MQNVILEVFKISELPFLGNILNGESRPSFGSDELRRQFLAPAIAGDTVSCIGVSEPGGGSDVAALTTKVGKNIFRLIKIKTTVL